jgi:hypothetical protein
MVELSTLQKSLLYGTIGAVVITFIILGIYYALKRGDAPIYWQPPGSSAAAEAPGQVGDMTKEAEVPALPVQGPSIDGESLRIVPRDTLLKVEYWSDRWRFNQPDLGHVSFTVNKNSGLVVSLSDQPGYPKAGYAFVIDRRGGHTTNFSDTTTSATYLTRLPQMDAPASNSALARNLELSNQPRRIDITYKHGVAELYVDGVLALSYNDPFPVSNISYVGFGDTGIKSGDGLITQLVID